MKKILLLICTAAISLPLFADNDKPIDVNRLPAEAREFIDLYFKDAKVALSTVDKELFDTTYDVFFANGRKVEFDSDGNWKDVDCQRESVPAGIIPESIRSYVDTNYPGRHVTDIERGKRGYEVTLDSGLELKFNRQFVLIEIDN